jgi:fibronectin-binding autotransporter adhesin
MSGHSSLSISSGTLYNYFYIGYGGAGTSTGSVTLNDYASITRSGGGGNDGAGTASTAVSKFVLGYAGTGTLVLKGHSSFSSTSGSTTVGYDGGNLAGTAVGSLGIIDMTQGGASNYSQLNFTTTSLWGGVRIGYGDNLGPNWTPSAQGYLNTAGHAQVNLVDSPLHVGKSDTNGEGATGYLNMAGTSTLTSTSTEGNAWSVPADVFIGESATGTSTTAVTRGYMTMTDYSQASISGSLFLGQGANNTHGGATPSTVTIGAIGSGSPTLTVAGSLNVGGTGAAGAGILTVNSGSVVAASFVLRNTATVNLNGGALVTPCVQAGNGVVNFDGGTLMPNGDSGSEAFSNDGSGAFNVYVKDGGATIDTNGRDIRCNVPLEAAGTGVGGLTKKGLGNLILEVANTYTGPTVVQAGGLLLANAAPFVAGTANEASVLPAAALGTVLNGDGSVFPVTANVNVTFSNKSHLSIATDGANLSTLGVQQLSSNANTDIVVVNVPSNITGLSSGSLVTYTSLGAYKPRFLLGVDSIGMSDVVAAYVAGPGTTGSVDLSVTDQSSTRGYEGIDYVGFANDSWAGDSWIENSVEGTFPTGTTAKAWFNKDVYKGVDYVVFLDTVSDVVLSSMLFNGWGDLPWTISKGEGTAPAAIQLHSTSSVDSLIQIIAGTASVAPDIKMAAGDPQIQAAENTSLTLSGVLSDLVPGQPAGITLVGPGTLTLAGANTFSGDTTIVSGTLVLANANALQGSTLDYSGLGALSFGSLSQVALGGLKGTQNLSLTNASSDAVALSVGGNGQSTTYNGQLSGSGSLTKKGAGTLVLTGANDYTGLTTVQGGTLQLNGAGARNPVLSLGGADIQHGWSKMVFDYSGKGDSSPATTVAGLLSAGYNGGAWNTGTIQSSTAVAEGTTLGWIDNTTGVPIVSGPNTFAPNTLTVICTIAGDVDLNGTIDFNDLGYVIGNYGATGAVWSEGDLNYDGVIDFNDLGYVIGNYGGTLPAALNVGGSHIDAAGLAMLSGHGITAVPEPGTFALLAASLLGLLAYAWRQRR